MSVLFCHGLESGPHGSKYTDLVKEGFDVYAPDCRGKNLAQRVELITPLLKDGMVVVGSSYGGIAAVLAAMNSPAKLRGLVLCAPALERLEPPNIVPEELVVRTPTVVIHGVHDDVVPIDVSRRFARRTGARLLEVDDGHRLSASHEHINREVRLLLTRGEG